MKNIVWKLWKESSFETASELRVQACKYSWAIPTPKAINRLVDCGPIVEIGAGSGYWAALITKAGGDVVAYDIQDEKFNFVENFHEVEHGGPEKAALHPDRTLFLCWPSYCSTFAREALKAYQGNTVVYIGEWRGCCATGSFFETLNNEWAEIETIDIPQWEGIHDCMIIFERKK